MFFLTKYELQHTVIYTVYLQFSSYLNGCLYLYYPMLLSHVLFQLAMTNNLCAYQINFLETRAEPKMGRQILGDFGGTKMAITSLKIKIFKKIQKVLA